MSAGKPTDLTPENYQQVITYIKGGVPYEMAAGAIGIAENTLYHWINLGDADIAENIDSEFAKFSKDIKQIVANNTLDSISAVNKQDNRWQARAWLLERHPTSRKHFSNVTQDSLDEMKADIKKTKEELEETKKKYEKPI